MYATTGVQELPAQFTALDASRPWIIFWSVHSLALLNSLGLAEAAAVVRTLLHCQRKNSGFAGSPVQEAHLAPTYAAIAALATLHASGVATDCMSQIDCDGVCDFVRERFAEAGNGGFTMTRNGEIDPRGAYCAAAACALLGTPLHTIIGTTGVQKVGAYLASCQTHEGGIGPMPGMEAHGGYTYCGLAASVLIEEQHKLDLISLIEWVAMRQADTEGGFAGRTSKLADSCYAFWQAGALQVALRYGFNSDIRCTFHSSSQQEGSASSNGRTRKLFDVPALRRWLLQCCQAENGGLRDKPGVAKDLYHTCYGLSGLAVAGSEEVNGVNLLLNIVQYDTT